MLEAVNSVLQSAPLVRANAEQASSADSFVANPDRIQKAAVAPYISPYIHMDVNYNKAVLQIRDSETGDVLNQFPNQSRLEAGLREAARREISHTQTTTIPGHTTDDGEDDVQVSSGGDDVAVRQTSSSGPRAQQIAAFQAAARAGNSNAGSVTIFA